MLNISSKFPEGSDAFGLYRSGKSCYVIARFCLEATFWDYCVPGFLLMQQAMENLIKSFLKYNKIEWKLIGGQYGSKGHEFERLIDLGKDIDFFKNKIISRPDFSLLLKELGDGYNPQRYAESGHFIENHEKMMDTFDEMVYLFVTEFAVLVKQRDNERLMAIPVPSYIEETFMMLLKSSYNEELS